MEAKQNNDKVLVLYFWDNTLILRTSDKIPSVLNGQIQSITVCCTKDIQALNYDQLQSLNFTRKKYKDFDDNLKELDIKTLFSIRTVNPLFSSAHSREIDKMLKDFDVSYIEKSNYNFKNREKNYISEELYAQCERALTGINEDRLNNWLKKYHYNYYCRKTQARKFIY